MRRIGGLLEADFEVEIFAGERVRFGRARRTRLGDGAFAADMLGVGSALQLGPHGFGARLAGGALAVPGPEPPTITRRPSGDVANATTASPASLARPTMIEKSGIGCLQIRESALPSTTAHAIVTTVESAATASATPRRSRVIGRY
jgi:hypothetical protein